MIDLLPCPFCGAKAEIVHANWTGASYITCSNKDCLIRPNTCAACHSKKDFSFDLIVKA